MLQDYANADGRKIEKIMKGGFNLFYAYPKGVMFKASDKYMVEEPIPLRRNK